MRIMMACLLALSLAGCASLRMESEWNLADGLPGPSNYAADYQWISKAAPAGFEQAPASVRVMIRDHNADRQVRAIGLTFFGSTVFDFILIAEPAVPQIRRMVRIGEGSQMQALAERLVRKAYLGQPTRPGTELAKIEQAGAEPAKLIEFQSGQAAVTWTLQLSQRDLCADSDYEYQSSPAEGSLP